MASLENLPVEKIVEICESMDSITLSKFVLTNKTYQNFCQSILYDRERFKKISDRLSDDELQSYIDTHNDKSKKLAMNEMKHRENTQTGMYKEIRADGLLVEKWYMILNGNKISHRINAPAEISYYPDGKIESEFWLYKGLNNRAGDLPAIVIYYPDGMVYSEEWYYDGIQYRSGNPALIRYYPDGLKMTEIWYEDISNDTEPWSKYGPAVIEYDIDGNMIYFD